MQRFVKAAICGILFSGACAMAQGGADYLDMTRVQVRGDKVKDFEDTIKKLADANRKYKGDRWIALTTDYGGPFGTYTFSSARQDLAGVETGMTAMNNALKEALGPLAGKVMLDLSAFCVTGRSDIRHRRWDLSVNAPTIQQDYMKLVAQTRWIRTLTLDMKQGRTLDYVAAWKPFAAVLRNISPAVPIVVSESNTGAPALYIGVYYKSWAEMDATTAPVQQAFQSAAYQQLTKVSEIAVSASNWEVLRVHPELSNPPDEIVQADPAFWKPKPAMAAPPAKKK
jgi:hypothetical protein